MGGGIGDDPGLIWFAAACSFSPGVGGGGGGICAICAAICVSDAVSLVISAFHSAWFLNAFGPCFGGGGGGGGGPASFIALPNFGTNSSIAWFVFPLFIPRYFMWYAFALALAVSPSKKPSAMDLFISSLSDACLGSSAVAEHPVRTAARIAISIVVLMARR